MCSKEHGYLHGGAPRVYRVLNHEWSDAMARQVMAR